MDLLIKDALIAGTDIIADIGIKDGKIVSVGETIETATDSIDVGGKLVSPAFIDPHIHLDKTNIVDVVRPNVTGTLSEAIEIIWDKKARYTVEDIVERAGKTIKSACLNGTTRMRTHVDVDTIGKLVPLEGIVEARKVYAPIMDVQIVAFPQEGIIQDPGTDKVMWQAMDNGADVVGGMPANEKTPEDSQKHVDFAFDLAKEFDADIDMHIDETDDPAYRTLEMVADATISRGWEGRVTAGHTCALAAYDDTYANYVMDKVKAARLNVITNPVTNLLLQGRKDKQPIRRGITRVKELLARGVNMSFGQDCVRDTFYPFGKSDPLEVALILAHAAQLSLPEEIDSVFQMMTTNAAKIFRLNDYGFTAGSRADLVVLDCSNIADAIRVQPTRLFVIKNGKLVAKNRVENQLYF